MSRSGIPLFRGWSLQYPVFCFLSSVYLLLLGELSVKHLPSSQLVPNGLFCSLCLSYVPLGTLSYISISDWKQWGLGVGCGSPRMPSPPPRAFLLGAREEGKRGDRLLTIQYSNIPQLLLPKQWQWKLLQRVSSLPSDRGRAAALLAFAGYEKAQETTLPWTLIVASWSYPQFPTFRNVQCFQVLRQSSIQAVKHLIRSCPVLFLTRLIPICLSRLSLGTISPQTLALWI